MQLPTTKDEKGRTIKEFPFIKAVPIGKATVMLKAAGYEPVVETVEVREGGEPAQLKKELKKKGGAAPTPAPAPAPGEAPAPN